MSTVKINFTPDNNTKKELDVSEQVFKWTITTGRRIIIITEFAVLLTFFSRFKLDRDLAAVSKMVDNNQAVVEQAFEWEIRQRKLQANIIIANYILDNQIDWKTRLDQLNQKIPENMTLDEIEYSKDEAKISGIVDSADGFGILLSSIISDPEIYSVVLEESKYFSGSGQYEFTLNVMLTPPLPTNTEQLEETT